MQSRLRMPAIVLAVLIGGGCKTTAPSVVFTGTVTDPAGDAHAVTGVPTSPDLISATIDVTSTDVTITVTCAPGTFTPSLTSWQALLDTDENISTGYPGLDGVTDAAFLGVDYLIQAVNGPSSNQATIYRLTSLTDYSQIGTAVVTFP